MATNSLGVIFSLYRRTRVWGVIWLGYCLKSVPIPSFQRRKRGAECKGIQTGRQQAGYTQLSFRGEPLCEAGMVIPPWAWVFLPGAQELEISGNSVLPPHSSRPTILCTGWNGFTRTSEFSAPLSPSLLLFIFCKHPSSPLFLCFLGSIISEQGKGESEGLSDFLKVAQLVTKNLNASLGLCLSFYYSSVQFSCSVMSDSLWPHGLQHARPPCPSPTHRAYSNSCP